MPHKHKRRRAEDVSSFDLPPTSIAKPLPSFHREPNHEPKRKFSKSRPSGNQKAPFKGIDDTPRAFARLLNFQKTGKGLPNALDDGTVQKGKKRKREPDKSASTASNAQEKSDATPDTTSANPPDIKILPGERLADFSARVDQALPIVGLQTKGQKGNMKIPGIKLEDRKTKHNRRLERMQTQWREEEARWREKLEEDMEDKEDEREEQQLLWDGVKAGGRKKKKQSRAGVDDAEADKDPWVELEKRRLDSRQKNLQDVVQAPPQLKGVKTRFKDHGGVGLDVGNVPCTVGSVRKREELASMRRNVIDEYRKTMRRTNHAIKV